MTYRYLIIFFFVIFYLSFLEYSISTDDISNQNISSKAGLDFFVSSYFCRDIDCEKLYLELFEIAEEEIYCAFFDFDLIKMKNKLDVLHKNKIKTLVLVDSDNDVFNDSNYILFDKRSAYMHNKFCIVDNILITGSFNPTINGRDKNDNNIVIIKNDKIIKIYEEYFRNLINESLNNEYKHSKNNRNFKFENNSIKEICFSRGGDCLDRIKYYLLQAKKSIQFMTFSFTDDEIGNMLLYKKYLENVSIEGVFEKTSINKYSEYGKLSYHLNDNSINNSIIKDCNKGKMHHKVFIIDKRIVVTGSFNPSNNADKNNDENMLIINDEKRAENYIKEFERIKLLCMM